MTQECLTNAVKHAQAEFVHIVLDYSDTTMIVLQVSDDGVGITSHDHHKPQTLGLRGMAERVGSLGGSLEISRGHQDDSQSGTTIKAVIPT